MKEKIEAQMKEIEAAMAQVVTNHAALVGRLDQCKEFLKMAEECCSKEESCAEAVVVE